MPFAVILVVNQVSFSFLSSLGSLTIGRIASRSPAGHSRSPRWSFCSRPPNLPDKTWITFQCFEMTLKRNSRMRFRWDAQWARSITGRPALGALGIGLAFGAFKKFLSSESWEAEVYLLLWKIYRDFEELSIWHTGFGRLQIDLKLGALAKSHRNSSQAHS